MIDGPTPGPAPAAGPRLAKTDAGRAECQRRTLVLSRPARNLLLIIDGSRSAEAWLGLVQGATAADLQALLQAGLVATVAAASTPATAAPAASQAPAPARMSLAQALETVSFERLARRVVAQARPQLGMVKGYLLVVEAEYCVNAADARALALRYVEQLRQARGDKAAIALAQLLLAPG